MDNSIKDYISTVSSPRQKAYQEMGFNIFFHYGLNTFTGKEWGNGKDPAEVFDPAHQDTDQWLEAAKAAGAKGVILTCKHHDGFCLWPTKTTEYSVKNSPYKNGHGDVVREVSDSCRKYGLKFGIYLSPWDRNSEYYATEKYNDFYIGQLKELLTDYGEIFCVWLDGACGSYMDGKPVQKYDFDRIYKTIRELQPSACITNCGPDIRWVGNEGGFARESEWNVVPAFRSDADKIADMSQQDENGRKMQAFDPLKEDLGSRKALSGFKDFIWYPAEVDVSIRPGWFYHKNQDSRIRSLKNLLHIYFTSVGGNSLLLLNVPPDRNGLIAPGDVRRLKETGDVIRRAFARPVPVHAVRADESKAGFEAVNCTAGDGKCYSPEKEQETYTVSVDFEKTAETDKVILEEQCDFSQRVEKFSLYAKLDGREKKVYEGTVIGFKKIALFDAVKADGFTLRITQCRGTPYIKQFTVYEKNGDIPAYPDAVLFLMNIMHRAENFGAGLWNRMISVIQRMKNR